MHLHQFFSSLVSLYLVERVLAEIYANGVVGFVLSRDIELATQDSGRQNKRVNKKRTVPRDLRNNTPKTFVKRNLITIYTNAISDLTEDSFRKNMLLRVSTANVEASADKKKKSEENEWKEGEREQEIEDLK